MVRVLLLTQGWREILTADLFADALKFVPTLPGKKLIAEHVREEIEHYEMCERLYRTLGGNLWRDVQARIARSPWPRIESWHELGMFQFLNDRAAKFQLLEYRTCSYAPYAAIINRILEEEEGHVGFGESVVQEMCEGGEAERRQAQALFDKWLPYCLMVFGRPGTDGNRYAVEVGLKARDSGAVMRDYIEDLKPAMARYGLRFPGLDKIGAEIGASLDLTLMAPARS
jgi:ring-1,2-phenylacetyl-CoA epoxidase subunit PaaA